MTDKQQLDPVIQALIDRLPPAGSAWRSDARTAWLEMMTKAFELIYPYREAVTRKKRARKNAGAPESESTP